MRRGETRQTREAGGTPSRSICRSAWQHMHSVKIQTLKRRRKTSEEKISYLNKKTERGTQKRKQKQKKRTAQPGMWQTRMRLLRTRVYQRHTFPFEVSPRVKGGKEANNLVYCDTVHQGTPCLSSASGEARTVDKQHLKWQKTA